MLDYAYSAVLGVAAGFLAALSEDRPQRIEAFNAALAQFHLRVVRTSDEIEIDQLRTNDRGDVVRVVVQRYVAQGHEQGAAIYHAVRVVGPDVDSRQPLTAQEVKAIWPRATTSSAGGAA